MSWTTPRTWTQGELVTPSMMNTHVRDNLAYLKDAPTFTGLTTHAAGALVTAPAASVGLTVNGAANGFTASITGSNTASQSFGVQIDAGTNASDTCLRLRNRAGTEMLVLSGAAILTLAADLVAQGAIYESGTITPTTITAGLGTNNYNPTGLSGARAIRISADGAENLTGLAGGAAGRRMILYNAGSFAITLKHNSGSSSAANRFSLTGGADYVLNNGAVTSLWYDGTSSLWRQI